jgi:hypothetical protein
MCARALGALAAQASHPLVGVLLLPPPPPPPLPSIAMGRTAGVLGMQGLMVVGTAPPDDDVLLTRAFTGAMEAAGLIHHGTLLELQFL